MAPLVESWRMDAATAYLYTLQGRGLALKDVGEHLRILPGHTPPKWSWSGYLRSN